MNAGLVVNIVPSDNIVHSSRNGSTNREDKTRLKSLGQQSKCLIPLTAVWQKGLTGSPMEWFSWLGVCIRLQTTGNVVVDDNRSTIWISRQAQVWVFEYSHVPVGRLVAHNRAERLPTNWAKRTRTSHIQKTFFTKAVIARRQLLHLFLMKFFIADGAYIVCLVHDNDCRVQSLP